MRVPVVLGVFALAGGCASLLGVDAVDYATDGGASDAGADGSADGTPPIDGAAPDRAADASPDGPFACPPGAFLCVDFEDGGIGALQFGTAKPNAARVTVAGPGYVSTNALVANTPKLDAGDVGRAYMFVDLPPIQRVQVDLDLRIDAMDVASDVELVQISFGGNDYVTLLARHGTTPEIGVDSNGLPFHIAAIPKLQAWNHLVFIVDLRGRAGSAGLGAEGGPFPLSSTLEGGAPELQLGVVFTTAGTTLGPWKVLVDNVLVELQ